MAAASQKLWSAVFSAPPETVALLSDALENGALSLTVMASPRSTKAEVEAIFGMPPDAATLRTRIAILATLNKVKAPKLIIRELPKLDWLKKVSEDFPPLPIARWVVFGAQHKECATRHHKIPLQIDATSAFGTGEHPTTRGCLLMLDWILRGHHLQKIRCNPPPLGEGLGAGLLDIGCGSGILSMAYSKATHGKAIGVDLDPASVDIAKSNIRANGLGASMRVALGNGYKAPLVRQHKPYDLIMANIFAGPLCEMANDLKKHLKPGGVAILSGLLTPQSRRVIAAHRMQGLRLIRHMKLGEWSVLAFDRPAKAE